MKLGISYHCYPGLDDHTEIALMKKNGFETTFLASEDERIDEIVPRLRQEGILIENLHGPLSDERCNVNDMWRDNDRAASVSHCFQKSNASIGISCGETTRSVLFVAVCLISIILSTPFSSFTLR